MNLSGNTVLLTHTLISNIMGSTVVCAQVAEELQRMGAAVLVLSSSLTGPARTIFEDRGIPVAVGEDIEASLFDFDYVWVHSQLLPLSFVRELGNVSRKGVPQGKRLPSFIFNHMSALDSSPDEHPYVPLLEETIASAEVFVSEEARDALNKDYDAQSNRGIPQMIVPNPAPSAFLRGNKSGKHRRRPTRMAIISNHVPEELFAAQRILAATGVMLDIIGEQGTVAEVTPELLANYDAIVTIGKTVQYCMMSSTPVYIYDKFGGFGYLSAGNFKACAYANFSGRGGVRKDGATIAEEIVADYKEACEYSDSMHDMWISHYGMGEVLTRLLSEIQPRSSVHFPYDGYENALMMQMRFAWRYYRSWDFELWSRTQCAQLENRVTEKDHAIAACEGQITQLHDDLEKLQQTVAERENDIAKLHEESALQEEKLQHVYASHSYRIGNMIMAPLSQIKKSLLRR